MVMDVCMMQLITEDDYPLAERLPYMVVYDKMCLAA